MITTSMLHYYKNTHLLKKFIAALSFSVNIFFSTNKVKVEQNGIFFIFFLTQHKQFASEIPLQIYIETAFYLTKPIN